MTKTASRNISNIRVIPDGYQVAITREGVEITKFFRRHTPASLDAAERYRDKMLKKLPAKRLKVVPRSVLKALGIKTQVVGIFRPRGRTHYSVCFKRQGRPTSRSFTFHNHTQEVAAYAAAIAFREELISAARG